MTAFQRTKDYINTVGQIYDTVVDANGSGDYTSLKTALDAGARFIFLKSGKYYFTDSPYTFPASTVIIGENWLDTDIVSTGLLGFKTSNYCYFQNLRFYNECTTNYPTLFNDSSGGGNSVQFEHCKFIEGSTMTTCYYNLLYMSSYSLKINNCYLSVQEFGMPTNNFFRQNDAGGEHEFCFNYLNANSTENSNYLIEDTAADLKIIGNTFQVRSNQKGIYVTGNYPIIVDNLFTGYTSSNRVRIEVTSSVSGGIVANNRFAHLPYTNAMILIAGNNVSVNGNIFMGSGSGVSAAYINVTGSNNVVTGNVSRINDGGAITNSGLNNTIMGNQGMASPLDTQSIYMKNTSGVSINAGEVVILKAVAAGDEIDLTTTAGDNKVYGMVTATTANNVRASVLIKGKTTLLKVSGTTDIAIGDFLSTSTTGGIAKKAVAGETAFATALEAYTTDDTNGVIDALLITPRLI